MACEGAPRRTGAWAQRPSSSSQVSLGVPYRGTLGVYPPVTSSLFSSLYEKLWGSLSSFFVINIFLIFLQFILRNEPTTFEGSLSLRNHHMTCENHNEKLCDITVDAHECIAFSIGQVKMSWDTKVGGIRWAPSDEETSILGAGWSLGELGTVTPFGQGTTTCCAEDFVQILFSKRIVLNIENMSSHCYVF